MVRVSLLPLAAPYGPQLLLIGVFGVASSLLTLAVPWLAGTMLGRMFSSSHSSVTSLVPLLLAVLAATALVNFASAYVAGATGANILADLRLRVYRHLQSLPIAFHENSRQGDTLALMTYELARLSSFLTGTLATTPAQLMTVVGAIFLMFRLDERLALLVPLLVPGFYLTLKIVGRRLRSVAEAIQKAEAEVVAVAEENLEMLPAIKAFAREESEATRYATVVGHAMRLAVQENRIFAALQPSIGFITATAAILLLFAAGQNVRTGSMSPAELFSFLFYTALLTRPAATLANLYGQVQSARGTMARMQAVLQQDSEQGYLSGDALGTVAGEITLETISFAYPGRACALRDVNLCVRPGEIVAITGANGAGKTTLINLLLRFYQPLTGRILLDGRDIANIRVQDLRSAIGLVSQRTLLFNGTVRDNIAFGLENASEATIERAARLAQAWDFILDMPFGFQTEIGDHGVRLSGGQRQRVALARALIKDPPILVLDEATSMYDLDGESAFIEACTDALHGRTVILITHRPASLAMATRILHLSDGGIRELSAAQAMTGVAG